MDYDAELERIDAMLRRLDGDIPARQGRPMKGPAGDSLVSVGTRITAALKTDWNRVAIERGESLRSVLERALRREVERHDREA